MGARYVQNFDDSLSDAIRMTYRISLRSSSLREPRHPLLKEFMHYRYVYIGIAEIIARFSEIINNVSMT